MGNDVLRVNFPFEHAAYSASSVTVSGSLNHAEFAEMSVTAIAGDTRIPAFIDEHGNFLAPDVPLRVQATGAALQVSASHPRRGTAQRSFLLSQEPDVASLADIEMDPVSGHLIAIDGLTALVLSIDLADGRREVLSGPTRGGGKALSEPVDLVLDTANDRAFVLDEDEDAVFLVELATGERSILYELDSFTGRIALNPVDGTIAVADGFGSNFRLVAIDPVSGLHTVLVDRRMGATAYIPRLTALALDMDYNRAILVSDNAVHAISLSTGAVRGITNRSFASTPFGNSFEDIEIRDGTAYLVDGYARAIIRVNLTFGLQEFVSNPASFHGERVGSGPLLFYPSALAMDVDGDRLFVADEFADALLEVDPDTGDRVLLVNGGVGAGDHFHTVSALAMSEDPVRLFAVDGASGTGVEMDLNTGDRRLILGAGNTGGSVDPAPTAVAVDPAQGILYYGDFTARALFKVDLAGGLPSVVSGAARGTGPLFGVIIDIELDSSSRTVYVLERYPVAVLAVDIDTGDRRIVSDATTGVGKYFLNPVGLQLDVENDRAFVSDADSRSIHEVNLLSGDRTVVSSWQIGGGTHVKWLGDIAYDPRNERFVAIDTSRRSLFSIDLATGDGEIISGDASLLLGFEDSDGRLQLLDVPRHIGGGAVFAKPSKIELSADHAIAYILDAGYDGLLAVELQNGDRQLISK